MSKKSCPECRSYMIKIVLGSGWLICRNCGKVFLDHSYYFEKNINKIIKKTGISREKLLKKIADIKDEYKEFNLSDEGILLVMAKDFGVELEKPLPIFIEKPMKGELASKMEELEDKIEKYIENLSKTGRVHLTVIETYLREAGENVNMYDVEKLVSGMIDRGKIKGKLRDMWLIFND